MSQTSVRLLDFPRVEGSTRDVNIQLPQEPQADEPTADAVCQARHRCRSVAQSPLLNHPRGKINRSTLPSPGLRFSGQKLRGLIPDCCRISLRGNRRCKVLEHCQPLLLTWLAAPGLPLNTTKSRISHTLDGDQPGFDFLGFNMRQDRVGKHPAGKHSNGQRLGLKTLSKPAQATSTAHLAELGRI